MTEFLNENFYTLLIVFIIGTILGLLLPGGD